RMAGGLDRSRSQQVRDVVAAVHGGRLVLDVVADQEPQVDIWGAERRTDLFEKVFGLPVAIQWAGRAGDAAETNGKPAKPRRRRPRGDAVGEGGA
ncbi:MAG: hypothetical protein ACKOHG_20570, partial [Planctomycetia bacterium]